VADPPTRPRCVFDCVVLLQAAVSRRGPAFALLTQVEVGRLELLISDSAIAELREVLVRPAVQRKFSVLTADVVEAFVAKLMAIANLIQPVPAVFRLPRDPDDELYINLALAGNAHYLITRDRDLLDLAAQATREAQYLRRLRPELRILDPVALLRELSAESL
jgi:putative PIN family toxin of toxin-antitoxin system